MSYKNLCVFTAALLSLLAPGASAIAKNAPPPNKKNQAKPKSPEAYYTEVRSEAAKAFSESLELQKQGKMTEAALAMKRSLSIREYFVDTDREIPNIKMKLAELWLAAGKKDLAIESLGGALQGYSRWHGPGCEQSIKPLTLMGNIQSELSDFNQALKSYNQAYILTKRLKGPGSPEAMKLRLQLAGAYKSAKLPDKAAPLYNESFELQKKTEDLIDHQQLVTALEDYAGVLKELKKDDEAKVTLDRANEIRGAAPKEPISK